MQLIKILLTRKNKKGLSESWGLFLCPYCLQEVEKRLSSGKKQKSCGCVKNELIGKGNKNKKRTEEFRQYLSKIKKGIHLSKKSRQKISKANKGKKRTEEQNKRQSKAQKGKLLTEQAKQKIREKRKLQVPPNKGKFGELSFQWQGGKSFEIYPQEFKKIKKKIYERDNYQCQFPYCIEIHNKLNAHHIDYNKKNNNPENLITLCINCHMKTNNKKNRIFWENYYQNILFILNPFNSILF